MKNHQTNHWLIQTKRGIFLLCFIMTACRNITPATLPSTPTPLAITTTATPLPGSSPTAIAAFTPVPLNLHPQVVVLAKDLPGPDDLVLAPDGSIYISDVSDGTIKQYTPDGQLHLILSGLNAPEGMVFAPDGSLIIAEQGRNRLVRYDFKSNTVTPFLNLENNTKNLGVDGIASNGQNLIVPDSPNGRVLEVSFGGAVREIASGLARPTGAWAEADGDILIADEDGNAVMRLHLDGRLEKVAALAIPDDVIEDSAGNIFVTTLGDDAVHLITAGTGQDILLVSGLADPQGMIFDLDGNLIVTDSGHHQLIKVIIR